MQDISQTNSDQQVFRPYTLFKAVLNKGLRESRDKTDSKIVLRQAEHVETIRIDWCDKRGIPHVWAGMAGLEQYTSKPGWSVCGFGDFDEWFRSGRFSQKSPKYQDMAQLYNAVRGLSGAYNETETLRAERDKLAAEIEQMRVSKEESNVGPKIQRAERAQSHN